MELLYLVNVFFVFFSGWIAIGCFSRNDQAAGYLNLFASALNAALVGSRFL